MVEYYRQHWLAISFLCVLWTAKLVCQTPQADSLKMLLYREERDSALSQTAYIDRLNQIAYAVRNTAHDTALHYAQKALERSRALGYIRGRARATMIIGIVAIYAGHYSAGLDAHLESLELYRSLKDSVHEAFLLNNIGYLYKVQNKLDIAREYFHRSYAIFRAAQRDDGCSLVLGNMGDIALKEGKYEEALRLEHEALERGQRSAEPFYANLALYHIGTILYAQKQYDSALVYQRQALHMFERHRHWQYVTRSLESLAAIYAAQKRYAEAFAAARRGLGIADSIGGAVERASLYERLSILEQSAGRYEEALRYYRLTSMLRDSLQLLNIEQRIQALEMMRLAEKREKELALAEKEQERLEIWRGVLIAAIVLVIVALVLAYHRYRYIARSEAQLRAAHEQIQQQQAQLQEQHVHIEHANAELTAINAELDDKNRYLQQVNAELEAANKRLEALNHEKDELLGIVAHDLKNPLTVIMTTSSALAKSAEELTPERIRTWSERMLATSKRMLNIISKLLRVNALEQGAQTFQKESIDVGNLITTVVEEYQERAAAKHIQLHCVVPEERLEAATDASGLTEILENLIDNAIKYSPHGTNVWVKAERIRHPSQEQEELSILVQDEGPGFSEADKAKMFKKFTRLSAKPTGGEDSTGLGLSIVKKLVDMLGGRMNVQSESGKGAAFIITIPVQ
ncbi:MAG: ATP-binding protein [Bacteroidota bacterium]|nr:ATP-binding protein [Candidatus Kapabacteria bacterium]MDW8220271.1 ATP-binding protein [Bacteroidota bacterium]